MNTAKLALVSMVSAALLTGAAAAGAQDDDRVRVKVDAGPNDQLLQHDLGVRYDFGDVFTTEVSEKRFEQLKRSDIEVEKVQKVEILHHKPGHDGGPPGSSSSTVSVSWVNPGDGETVSGAVNVEINATDSDGSIQSVEWKVDSDDSYRDATFNSSSGLWEDSWETMNYADGDHDLTANATSDSGDSEQSTITVTVDNEEDSSGDNRVEDQTPYGIEQIYKDDTISKTSGGSGIGIAVLDTGVDTDHPDLANRLEQCVDFTGGGPFNTKIDEGKCEDKNGHGTHVAGTALADAGSDKKGVYGVAPEADLFAYKVLDNSGSGYADDIAAAIDYAANNGAEVVSMSLGSDSQSSMIESEIAEHYSDVVVVAAAGNSGEKLDTMGYPGRNNNTIGVTAINESYYVPDFSSRGLNESFTEERDGFAEVTAAGVDVLSTWNDGTYNSISGTSMATPHVSGLAAKLWDSGEADLDGDGTTTTQEVRDAVQTSVSVDVTEGGNATEGYDPAAGLGLPTVE